MSIIPSIKKFNLNFRLAAVFLLLAAASIAVTLFMLYLQPATGISIRQTLIESRGMILLLNWLPVALIMSTLFFACGNLVVSCAVPALLFVLLSVVNRYMIAMRWAPLRPFDLLLGMEFLGIAKSIQPVVFVILLTGILLFAAVFAVCLRLIKNKKPRPILRTAGFLISVIVFFLLNFTVYSNKSLNGSLPYHGSRYNETDQYQSQGFLYSFIYTLNTSKVEKPPYYEQYSPFITERDGIPAVRPQSVLPNIIMVQSEAFSEIALSSHISFEGFIDPMRFYKELKSESIAGYIVTPHMGGGTSDTEFDVLTGLNTRDFRSVPYAFTVVTRPFSGFTGILKSLGYTALAQHPGAGWFYNRQNVYPLLGFDSFIHETDYDITDTKGMYITEHQTINRLIAEYEKYKKAAPDTPLFLDCITIQNHGPYVGKYGAGTNFNSDIPMNTEEREALANYIEGLADCDRELERLAEYITYISEPIVLAYYGDHQPSLPPQLYQSLLLGTEDAHELDGIIKSNRVPFLIWANEAAKSCLNASAFEESLPQDRTLSASYLGAALLEMLEIEDPFTAMVNDTRREYPVVLEEAYRNAKGEARIFNPETDTQLALYRSWAYHRVAEAPGKTVRQ